MSRPKILVTYKKIEQGTDFIPLLESMVKSTEPLFIVAEDVTGEALSALVVNKMRGVLDDIAIAAGVTYVAEEAGHMIGRYNVDEAIHLLDEAAAVISSQVTPPVIDVLNTVSNYKLCAASVQAEYKL
eukprot:18367-Heterococcus_DN1.PRE.3